jgi:predicted DNA-binding transcriptional regulator AlpA
VTGVIFPMTSAETVRGQFARRQALARREHDPVLTAAETAAMLSITTRTLRRMMAEGLAPKCVQLGKRRHGFRLSAIDDWLAKRERGAA